MSIDNVLPRIQNYLPYLLTVDDVKNRGQMCCFGTKPPLNNERPNVKASLDFLHFFPPGAED